MKIIFDGEDIGFKIERYLNNFHVGTETIIGNLVQAPVLRIFLRLSPIGLTCFFISGNAQKACAFPEIKIEVDTIS